MRQAVFWPTRYSSPTEISVAQPIHLRARNTPWIVSFGRSRGGEVLLFPGAEDDVIWMQVVVRMICLGGTDGVELVSKDSLEGPDLATIVEVVPDPDVPSLRQFADDDEVFIGYSEFLRTTASQPATSYR